MHVTTRHKKWTTGIDPKWNKTKIESAQERRISNSHW